MVGVQPSNNPCTVICILWTYQHMHMGQQPRKPAYVDLNFALFLVFPSVSLSLSLSLFLSIYLYMYLSIYLRLSNTVYIKSIYRFQYWLQFLWLTKCSDAKDVCTHVAVVFPLSPCQNRFIITTITIHVYELICSSRAKWQITHWQNNSFAAQSDKLLHNMTW